MFDYEQARAAAVPRARGPVPGGGRGALLQLQALAGNRAVAAAVQRCAPENPGCGCAKEQAPEHEEPAVARLVSPDGLAVQRMAPCPPRHPGSAPPGWKAYFGDSSWFHCGYRGILEDRKPTTGDPQNECFYDHGGILVDENHPHAGCRGTPNQYDSSTSTLGHIFLDRGGILRSGWGAFWASRGHDLSTAANPVRCAAACQGVPDPRCMGTCMNQRR
ncbi:hypothetical protein ACQPZF_12615 [Actinosynnema sp. CS-041913]|uniref:hypothetical protein n=1 Tax=Actinosynnema sp. CS-041913 TaxID=3239917 RepID=UPI003D92C4CE